MLKIKISFDLLIDIVKIQASIYALLVAFFYMMACVVFATLGAVDVLGKKLARNLLENLLRNLLVKYSNHRIS